MLSEMTTIKYNFSLRARDFLLGSHCPKNERLGCFWASSKTVNNSQVEKSNKYFVALIHKIVFSPSKSAKIKQPQDWRCHICDLSDIILISGIARTKILSAHPIDFTSHSGISVKTT